MLLQFGDEVLLRKERQCERIYPTACGGDHTAASGGGPVRRQAAEIQQVRSEHKVTYAEAVKISKRERRDVGATSESRQSANTGITTDKLVLFSAYVIKWPEQAKTETENMTITVKAAAKVLDMKNLWWDKIQADLSKGEGTPEGSSHNPLC